MSRLWMRGKTSMRDRSQMQAADVSASTAHDFGNVLQCATSALRVCERQLLDRGEADLATMLGGAQDALARARLLALRLAGLDRGPIALPLSVGDAILSMRRLLGHAVGEEIVLATIVADRLPSVLCDMMDLENAVLNLAINAREAMPGGGRLCIQVTRGMADCRERPAGVTISVSDSGCGMSPEVAERAFTRSFSTKGAGEGRGLGLAAVRQFARGLGGSVALQSVVGSGTTVRLHLPAANNA